MRQHTLKLLVQRLKMPLLCGCILLTSCRQESNQDPGLQVLAEAFSAANQAATIEPMLRLYGADGSDENTIQRLKGALAYELGLPIERIDFEPLTSAPEETIDYTHDGIHYGPSLKPRYRMRVIYSVEDRFTSLYTIGRSQTGDWRIICAKPKPKLTY
jgi:hypothetical protein